MTTKTTTQTEEIKMDAVEMPAPSPAEQKLVNTPDMAEVEEAEASEKMLVPIIPSKSKTSCIARRAATLNALIQRFAKLLSSSSKSDNVLSLTSYILLIYTSLRPTAKRLAILRSLIADYRIFARLLALPGLYSWLLSTLESPPKDCILRVVAVAEVVSCLAYQVLENAAYLAGRDIVTLRGKNTLTKVWLWSSRFWAAYVALEGVRLVREWNLGQKTEASERTEWWKDVVSNSAWAPLTVHWSVEQGIISNTAVGFFGTVAGIISVSRAWRNTV